MKQQLPISDYARLSDEDLVHRYAQRNDRNAVTVLFDRYGHLVLGLCIKELGGATRAQELTRAVFIDMLDELPKFRIDHFKSWLYRYVKQRCAGRGSDIFDALRSRDGEYWVNDDHQVRMMLEQAIEPVDAGGVLKTLPQDERTALGHFYGEQQTHETVARRMNSTPARIKKLLQKGRINLRNKLEIIAEVRK